MADHNDRVYSAIAAARTGFVEAPAGCGKTEAIVRTVEQHCAERQLVLTHTHAGVDALRHRFRSRRVPTTKYHVDTIASWAWSWVRSFPNNALYCDDISIPKWTSVYRGMAVLLEKGFVLKGIENSYSGVIVDEYQDCTVAMHNMIAALAGELPCRVLGDPLQGIFDFNDPLVDWQTVKDTFSVDLGTLDKPYRWIRANNKRLGQWLLNVRRAFQRESEPNYTQSPIAVRRVSTKELNGELLRIAEEKSGRMCVIGPKNHSLPKSLTTTLVRRGFRMLEANDLPGLRLVINELSRKPIDECCNAINAFVRDAYGGLPKDDREFAVGVLSGDARRVHRSDRRRLCYELSTAEGNERLIAVLEYVSQIKGVCCKWAESVSALRDILDRSTEEGEDIRTLYAEDIRRRKYRSRATHNRCIGSTLLVKGLEFDHSVVVRPVSWKDTWGNYRDVYVALTRGSRSVTLIEYSVSNR